MTKKRKNSTAATETLRLAIEASELNQNEIGRRAGICASMLSRFVRCDRGMTLWTAAKVADVLGLTVRIVPKGRSRKGR